MSSQKLPDTVYIIVPEEEADDTEPNSFLDKIRMVSAVTKRSLLRAERRASVLEVVAKRESERPPTGEFMLPDKE